VDACFSAQDGLYLQVENTATNYQHGYEFHREWAVGTECVQELVIGIIRL